MWQLAWKNLRGSGFRSLAIFLGVMGAAGILLATMILIKGAQYSLDAGLKRLGADILVVPVGAESKVESALLMGKPTNVWMPQDSLQMVSNIPGVEAVSPQIYLSSLFGAACCSVSEMFIVVYDPQTDFTVTPWSQKNLGRDLAPGEVIGGCYVFVPPGEEYIKIFGSELTLKGNLAPTGTGIDQTLFMTMETAKTVAAGSILKAAEPLNIPDGQISTIMVKTASGVNPHRVALNIIRDTTGIWPIESPDLFGTFRSQMNGLLWGFFAVALLIWFLAVGLVGIIFSMAANERTREFSVLRAVGGTRSFVFRLVSCEALMLAISGAVGGIVAAGTLLYLFRDLIAGSLKMPFLFPSLPSLAAFAGAGILLAVIGISLAALIPAYRVSRRELAMTMRE